MLLQVAGEKLKAITLSSMRQGIVFVPVILLLPPLFTGTGIEGIYAVNITPALSDFITALVSIPFMLSFIKKRLSLTSPNP